MNQSGPLTPIPAQGTDPFGPARAQSIPRPRPIFGPIFTTPTTPPRKSSPPQVTPSPPPGAVPGTRPIPGSTSPGTGPITSSANPSSSGSVLRQLAVVLLLTAPAWGTLLLLQLPTKSRT